VFARPLAAELGDPLFERELAQEQGGAGRGRQALVPPIVARLGRVGHRLSFSGCGSGAHARTLSGAVESRTSSGAVESRTTSCVASSTCRDSGSSPAR